MNHKPLNQIILAFIFLGLALFLSFLTSQVFNLSQSLLPMHFVILICGFMCGPKYASLTGLIAPLLSALVIGQVDMVPTAIAMAFELGTYGLVLGLLSLYIRFDKISNLYIMLILAMVIGRISFGLLSLILYDMIEETFSWQTFLDLALLKGLMGIIIQLIMIPPLIYFISPYIERYLR
jgi:thiamine transporter ThiT